MAVIDPVIIPAFSIRALAWVVFVRSGCSILDLACKVAVVDCSILALAWIVSIRLSRLIDALAWIVLIKSDCSILALAWIVPNNPFCSILPFDWIVLIKSDCSILPLAWIVFVTVVVVETKLSKSKLAVCEPTTEIGEDFSVTVLSPSCP